MTALALALIIAVAAAGTAAADFASDRAECTEQLTVLLPCLGFVEGEARLPTPDCCVASKTVVEKSFKCICVLVKDRNEPDLGLKINVTRAVTLPGSCHVPANISDCPKLLKLPPGSPAAMEFYELEKEIVKNAAGEGHKNSSNLDAKSTAAASDSSMAKRRLVVGTYLLLQFWISLFLWF